MGGFRFAVIVEQLPASRLAALGAVQHRVVLEQVLAALDRPDLRAAGRARVQDKDVRGSPRPDLEDPDLVVLRRRAGRVEPGQPLERDPR